MTPSKKPIDFLNLYEDITPDPWAVTKLRARMLREEDPAEIVLGIFKRYVLTGSLAVLLISGYLNMRSSPQIMDNDYTEYIFGIESNELTMATLPDYTRILETE